MAEEPPVICSACETPLGDPNNEVKHPDDPDPPENAHFVVQVRKDGEERLQCTETGQLAKPLGPDDPEYPGNEEQDESPPPQPSESSESAENGPPTQQQQRNPPVYDIEEEKDQMDLLREVITNPSYGLNDEQITEIRAWAQDYGGQLPPDTLQEITGLMDGVQKQTAQLMRQRYELKINKWVRDQQSGDNGPHIGTGFASPSGRVPNIQMPPSEGGKPSKESMERAREEGDMQGYNEGPSNSAIRENRRDRESRRESRRNRRRDAMDKAADELALGVAENVGDQLGSNYGRAQNIMWNVLEAKAKRDPDWFLEKEKEVQESLGISIFDLLEPSEAKKQEQQRKGPPQPKADKEVDEALSRVMQDEQPQANAESDNTPRYEPEYEDYDTATEQDHVQNNSDTDGEPKELEFEEIFG